MDLGEESPPGYHSPGGADIPAPNANASEPLVHATTTSGVRARYKAVPRWVIGLVLLLPFLAAIVVLAVLLAKKSHNSASEALYISNSSNYASVSHVDDTRLGAANALLSEAIWSPPNTGPETQVVYNGGNGQICVLTKSGSTWAIAPQCVSGAHPIPNTPITLLDWFGGPSIYYVAEGNVLSGIDMPPDAEWRISSVRSYNVRVHPQSQITSVTWRNGTSAWVHYQDTNLNILEFGVDDYRESSWRGGSFGPIAYAPAGSALAATRWINGTDEVEELFYQLASGAIAGKVFAMQAWRPDEYTIDGTVSMLATSIGATVIDGNGNSTILIGYAQSGNLNLRARAVLEPDLGNFSTPVQVADGDGGVSGIAAVGSLGVPRVYFASGQNILEVSSDNAFSTNWTTGGI